MGNVVACVGGVESKKVAIEAGLGRFGHGSRHTGSGGVVNTDAIASGVTGSGRSASSMFTLPMDERWERVAGGWRANAHAFWSSLNQPMRLAALGANTKPGEVVNLVGLPEAATLGRAGVSAVLVLIKREANMWVINATYSNAAGQRVFAACEFELTHDGLVIVSDVDASSEGALVALQEIQSCARAVAAVRPVVTVTRAGGAGAAAGQGMANQWLAKVGQILRAPLLGASAQMPGLDRALSSAGRLQ
jgi:hypothetical protein